MIRAFWSRILDRLDQFFAPVPRSPQRLGFVPTPGCPCPTCARERESIARFDREVQALQARGECVDHLRYEQPDPTQTRCERIDV